MPLLSTIKCNRCDLTLPSGAGGYMYVLNAVGERVVCSHPGEWDTIEQVTGLDWYAARQKGLLGHVSYCLCFECTHQLEIDVDRDVKQCPQCKSLHVRTANACLGGQCPRCHEGLMVEEPIGVS